MTTRPLTKLERKILELTPSQASTVEGLWAGNKRAAVHPYRFRSGKGRVYSLEGTSRAKIRATLIKIGLSDADIQMGNDAPRGGQEGKWAKLTASGFSKIRRILN